MTSRTNQINRASQVRWVVAVEFVDGNAQDFVFADQKQAREAAELILNADPGSVVKLSEHVFVQRDQVASAQVVHRDE